MPGESRRMRGMQGNARGSYGNGCNVTGECRGMPGEHTKVGAKCHENAEE